MRFRMGLMIGFGAGYVMGTKAGRERYEEIRERANKLWESEKFEQVREQVEELRGQVMGQQGNERRVPLEPEPGSAPAQEPFVASTAREQARSQPG